ncbi:hypothetical protein Val02_29950 [Virgisporangium aliadipatigenens]|uniref:Thioredoxin domain-containing protein n=1 Tax=Virgisporangium aliadipatigenens TaxID=741659 RepID=A0A8J3YIS2_9ACTN|nr:TlpA disulfide reductase family protein [Virgisporangium aliadipatigenens]GIJ46109.1 hypothetical protein Val02_29950 [Virgisporangium aliadipatigenens]
MSYETTAVLVLAVATLANLVFLAALARRVNRLAAEPRPKTARPAETFAQHLLPIGTEVPAFTATAVDGSTVSRDGLTGDTLVAFLAPGCSPCEELLPPLAERVASHPGGAERVLLVILGGDSGYGERFTGNARIILDNGNGPIGTAFKVRAYPAVYLIDATGRVLAAGGGADALTSVPTGVPAGAR